MSADKSEFPHPATSMLDVCSVSGLIRACSCFQSPYHSKGVSPLVLKNPSQKLTLLKSACVSGRRPALCCVDIIKG